MADLDSFWPSETGFRDILTTEAEAATDAISLAVHQPVSFRRRRLRQAAQPHLISEQELIDWLLKDTADGFRILPLVGQSGVGKSHVVRWLHTQLDCRSDREKRLVIRVPKGESLKGVLQRILARVEGPQYEEYRNKIREASDRIDPKGAAGLLCERLSHALEQLAESADARSLESNRLEGDAEAEERQIRSAFGNSGMLPTLLRNQQLRDLHFVRTEDDPGVVRRLVAQLFEDRVGKLTDDREHQFVVDDLILPESLYQRADEFGQAVLRAADRCARDPDRREKSVRLLNAALDPAKRELIGIGETVEALFLSVRHQLHQDGKELILLVEDFAVLSGLQGQLLQVVQQGGQRAELGQLCMIRSVLAYTPGYLNTDTVMTRAEYEFVIPDVDDDRTVTHDRIRRFLASYLHAARLGKAALDDAFNSGAADAPSRDWLPPPEEPDEAAKAIINAFGREDGIPLFPFNQAAISAFAEENCVEQGRLVFNPRYIIQRVLRHVLEHRDSYERSSFPPPSLQGRSRPDADVFASVRDRIPSSQRERYATLLTYWGAETNSETISAVTGPIARAFGLPELESSEIDVPKKAPRSDVPQADKSNEASKPGVVREWEKILSGWEDPETEQPLNQSQTNNLRKHLAAALDGTIDWDWFCYRPPKKPKDHEQIYVSGGKTTRKDAAIIAVADAERRDPVIGGQRKAELVAVAAFGTESGTVWDYEGGEDDLVRYCSFIGRHAESWRNYLLARPLGPKWSPISLCTSGLVLSGRVLLGPRMSQTSRAGTLNALFESVDPPMATGGENVDRWEEVRGALAKLRNSEWEASWRKLLLDLVAARQGGAAKVHAIDVAKLKEALDESLSSWSIDLDVPDFTNARDKLHPFVKQLGDMKRTLSKFDTALERERLRIGDWLSTVKTELGNEWSKDELARQLLEGIERLPTADVGAGEKRQAREAIRQFQKEAVTEAVKAAGDLVEPGVERAVLLSTIGRDFRLAQESALEVIQVVGDLVGKVENRLVDKLHAGGNPTAEARAHLEQALCDVKSALEKLES